MRSEPKRAISPTIRPPTTGTATASTPRPFSAGLRGIVLKLWKYARLVTSAISFSSTRAVAAPSRPMTTANGRRRTVRAPVEKSESSRSALSAARSSGPMTSSDGRRSLTRDT
jgi:hypothetical protein